MNVMALAFVKNRLSLQMESNVFTVKKKRGDALLDITENRIVQFVRRKVAIVFIVMMRQMVKHVMSAICLKKLRRIVRVSINRILSFALRVFQKAAVVWMMGKLLMVNSVRNVRCRRQRIVQG